mgnify:CR=1 FL=1
MSGNWCWIEKQHLRQRYTLNHGWRFAIFVTSLCTYIYVFVYMSRRLRPQGLSNPSSSIPDDLDYEKIDSRTRDDAVLAGCSATPRISLDEAAERPDAGQSKKHRRAVSSFSFARKLQVDTTPNLSHDNDHTTTPQTDDIASSEDTHVLVDLEKGLKEPSITALPIRRATRPDTKTKVDREIWKMLLLNMYPVTYLILWLPGIANRIAEGIGHEVRVLVVLQSSTQFIGLANATVYLYKEHRRDVREWWCGSKWRKRMPAKAVKTGDTGSLDAHVLRSVSP